MNIQVWFPLGLTGWSPCCPRNSKGLLQHHTSKALILQCSAFFMVQLSHPYMITGKTIDMTTWTFVNKVSLLFNILSRFVIAFLPRIKHLLISWLQSPSAVILKPKKNQFYHYFCCFFFPAICHKVMGPDTMILFFWMLILSQFFTLLFHLHQEAL